MTASWQTIPDEQQMLYPMEVLEKCNKCIGVTIINSLILEGDEVK